MTDTLSPAARSARMALIKGRDTAPERRVAAALRAAGLRFRRHDARLPGTPDFVLPSRRLVILVHGCFWHRHAAATCRLARLPRSRLNFWLPKLEANRLRDARQRRALRAAAWRVWVVWECGADEARLRQLAARAAALPRQ